MPADLAQGLEGAGDGGLGRVVIEGNGYALHWPPPDVDLAIPDLMAGLLGTRRWMARRAGRGTTENKATATCEYVAKGGWPRKAAKDRTGRGFPCRCDILIARDCLL